MRWRGKDPQRMGSAHPNLVPYRAFQAKDGWFVIGLDLTSNGKTYANISTLSKIRSWATNAGRIANREVIESMVGKIVAKHNRNELEELLKGIPVPQ